MEILGKGFEALGAAVSSIAMAVSMIGVVGIFSMTFLIHAKDITIEQAKEFLSKEKRYR